MAIIKVAGYDPSLKNFGSAHGHYDMVTKEISVVALGLTSPTLITTKSVRTNSKDMHRAEQLAADVFAVAKTKDILFVELPVGSQGARPMVSYGACIGIFASLRSQGTAIIEVTASAAKIAATKNKNASKDDMIDAMYAKYPDLNWPTYKRHGVDHITREKAEHMADAIAVILAGFQTTEFKTMLPMLERFNSTLQ